MKTRLKSLLKLLFVAGLLYFLYQKGFISVDRTKKAFGRWDLIGTSLAIYLFSTFLGVVRWHILLKAHDIHLPFWRTSQLTLIGNFFNVALPGAVSGDFVKAFYVGRESEGKRADAFGSILFDRVAGLSALVILCAIALITHLGEYLGTPLFKAIQLSMTLAAITVVAFYGYLFLVREKFDPLLKVLKSVESRIPRLGSVTRVYLGLRHYHNHRAAVLSALGISLLVHAMIGFACLEFARALGEESLSLLSLYVVVPLGLLVTAVPVAPAGIGTGHYAFGKLFQLLGSELGADVFSLIALTTFFIGAIGGVVYLQFRSHVPQALPTDPSEPEGAPEPARASLKPAQ